MMPDDAQERLQKSLQSRLRQTLIRCFNALDRRDVGTSRLLSVPLIQLRSIMEAASVVGVACSQQWTTLAHVLARCKTTTGSRNIVVSGVLQYEPNLRLQALSTVVHRPDEGVLLRCTECGHPMSSSWYFVHPRTGTTQVLTPSFGHYPCFVLHKRRCYFRSGDRRESIQDVFTLLDFCEHARARKDCVQCSGSACCVHGKQRRKCRACASLVKRRKKR